VNLRLNRPDQAIADYDAALALRPATASSLYGRGLAYLAQGNSADSARDIAAAKQIDPDIAGRFRGWGVAEP
jgi:tetratricopeptide (TPR) repeat protein